MPRLLDLIAIGAVAVVVLLPKPSVDARPALEGDPAMLDRVAALQDDVYRAPDAVEPRVRLADAFLSSFRSDWALVALAPLVEREAAGAPPDARVHLELATAHAERLEPAQTVAETARVETICDGGAADGPRCPPGTTARAQLIGAAMKALLDGKIDPAQDPVRAKREVYKVLHPSRPGFVIH
jgi:hypothetical protein